jgi:MFS family permease
VQGRKNIIFLGLVSLFTDIASQMIYPLLPAFILSLGTGASGLGLIEGIAESTAALFKTPFGRWSDRVGKRKGFVAVGYGLAAVVKPLLYWMLLPWQVLLIRFGDRLGKAVRGPARDALLAGSVNKKNRGAAFGLHRGFDRLGAFLGPLLALAVLRFFPEQLRLVFLLAGIPAILALAFLPFVAEPKRKAKQADAEETLSPWQSRAFLFFLAGNILFTLGNSSNAFLLLKAEECGLPLIWLPALWMVYNLVCTLAAPFFGALSDRWGRRSIIAASFAYYTLLYVLFAFAQTNWHIWALFAAYGIYYGLSSGVFKAFIADLVPQEQRGTAYGLYQTGIGIALLPASLLMGVIWESWGSQWAFLASAGFALTGFLVCLPALKKA